jgi:hypothetical protein
MYNMIHRNSPVEKLDENDDSYNEKRIEEVSKNLRLKIDTNAIKLIKNSFKFNFGKQKMITEEYTLLITEMYIDYKQYEYFLFI